MIKQLLAITLLVAFVPNAIAVKPMKDDEIKKLIVQGSLLDYDSNCTRDYLYYPPRQDIKPDSVSKQTTREFQYGRNWGMKDIQSETQTQSTNVPPVLPICICPCPYSRDPSSKECGQESAYFDTNLREDDKPKCYPEDVKTYEVNDFRSDHGIPLPPPPEERRP